MNEQIRKLAERAGFSYMPSAYPDMADLYKCHDFEIEKFAELIAAHEREECAKLCMAVPRTGAYFAGLIRARSKK